jgi:hypothetical protein
MDLQQEENIPRLQENMSGVDETPETAETNETPQMDEQTQQLQKILGDDGLNKFVRYISTREGPNEILDKLRNRLTPAFTENIAEKLESNDEEYVTKLVDTINTLFSFMLYSSLNRVDGKKILDEFKLQNPDVNLDILNLFDSLTNKGVNSFLINLQYIINEISKGDYRGTIDLVLYVINNLLEYLSIKNETLVSVIDVYLQIFANILLFNPVTGPVLRMIGVGVAPFIAFRRFSERNKEELNEVVGYLTEMTPSSKERAKLLLEDAKTKGYKDKIMIGLGELKRSLASAKITLNATNINPEDNTLENSETNNQQNNNEEINNQETENEVIERDA